MYSPRELKGLRGGPPGCGEGLGQGGGIQAWVDSGHEPLLSVPWTKVGAREAGGQGADVSVHISKLTAMPPEARGLGAAPRGEVSPTSPQRGIGGLKVPCPAQTPRCSDPPPRSKRQVLRAPCVLPPQAQGTGSYGEEDGGGGIRLVSGHRQGGEVSAQWTLWAAGAERKEERTRV